MAVTEKEMSQFAVIGMGRFGLAVTKELFRQGKEVLAIDINPDKVNAVSDFSTHAAVADGSDEQTVRALGIPNYDAVVICMSDMQANIMSTLICKELGVPFIVCRAVSAMHKMVLEKIGANYIVVPEEDMARKVAVQLVSPHLNDMMELSKQFSIAEIESPEIWNNRSLLDINIRKKYGATVLVIKRGADVIVPSDANFTLKIGDNIVIGGSKESIERMIDKLAASGH